MAFVYRYSSIRGTPRYVGMVNGDTLEHLYRRIKQHKNDERFAGHEWIVEYIDGLTVTDAELLESHFIGIYQADLFNVAKRRNGPISLEIVGIPEWKPLPEYQKDVEKNIQKPLCGVCSLLRCSGIYLFLLRKGLQVLSECD